MVMKDRWKMPAGLRKVSAVVAIVALAVGGAKVVDDNTAPGSGFSAVATVAADPTGPPGPTGGMTDGGGSQFQPPQMPSSMPDYQGGNNQPPLDQNSGISIYNSGSLQAPQQVPGQQAGQQPQQAQQPADGTQIPDYQTNPGYTQGPGKPNPDYQAPKQQSPQQPQQGQQPEQQQPSQAPTQTGQPTTSAPPSQTPERKSDSDQSQNQDKYRCVNGASALKYYSAKGPIQIRLTDGGCENCDYEKPRENPNNCTSQYASGVAIRPAKPGAEGGLESIMIFYTSAARAVGEQAPLGILWADSPDELKKWYVQAAGKSADAAFEMWNEILCHAQASDIKSPSDLSKTLYNRLTESRDSNFQQFLCHFFGAPKKFWDAEGGWNKESWNVEWARAAKGTMSFVFSRHPCN
ncbi:hypothetical protein [Mycobacteroides franklinii]|uniref:hypothetical protein n=1 Tax=Mycobacteroides franklinii TaxID=948102 RepID=UPI001E362291|nr:hypothetical protein [Mycobacteroides franklinii]